MENTPPLTGVVVLAGALPVELSGIRGKGAFVKAASGDIKYFKGGIHGVDVALVVSGIGEDRAYRAAKAVCEALSPKAYVSVGLSAALSPALKPGDIVIGESTASLASGTRYDSDSQLLEKAREALGSCGICSFGPVIASPKVVVKSTEKKELASKYNAVALDMETAGAARAAMEAGVPFIAIRAISDTLDEDLPVDFNRFTRKDGGMCWPRFIAHVLTHPATIGPLMRLGRQSNLAAGNLAWAVERVVGSL